MCRLPVLVVAFLAVAAWMAGSSAHGARSPSAQAGYASVCGLQAPAGSGGSDLPEPPGECCAACPGAALPHHVAEVALDTAREEFAHGREFFPASQTRAGHAARAPPLHA